MADRHTYNHDDIKRYLQQQMTPKEMHAFEKAMMEDPFLADAFEGFQNSDAYITNRHLHEIEQQIAGAKEKAKVVPIIPAAKPWWRVAALFVVIAGMGILTYQLLDQTPSDTGIAGNASVPAKAPEAPAADTLQPADEPFTQFKTLKEQPHKSERKHAPVIKQTNEGMVASSRKVKPENEDFKVAMRDEKSIASENPAALSAPMIANESVKLQNRSLFKQSLHQKFEGQVTDINGKPLASASVIVNNSHVAVTDSNGSFKINSPDSIVEVNVALVGFMPATAKITKKTTGKIVLKESNLALNDIVVTGYGKPKKKETFQTKATLSSTMPSTAEPENGWQSFNNYINAAVKTIKDAGTNYVSGDVHLEFRVDSNGNPSEIKVSNPNTSNAAMQAKAIELLQKGPRWKPGKNLKARVVIHF